MKKTNTYISLLFSLLLIFTIAACGPSSTQTADTEPEETGSEAEEAEGETSEQPASEGSQTTASGLQYVEVEAGTGAAPNVGDIVAVHYTGTLEDGTEFDSSIGGEPIEFPLGVGYVIPGWDEGIALMREGGTAQLIIPPELAYGPQDRPGIPANSTLYFDVELVSVSEQPTPPPAPPPTSIEESEFTTTESGLMYAPITPGGGESPQEGEIVTIHFVGWTEEDNAMFADSHNSQPLQFTVGREEIIPGWDEAVMLMTVGEVAQFIMPSELAFGEEGIQGLVPPNTSVIFELQLLEITPPPPPPVSVDEDDYEVLESGIKIFTIEEGDGNSPQEGDTVSVHYRLWLEDGTQIDSSYDRGQPFPFVVGTNSTIPGWEEGVLNMVEGETAQIVVPPELGYGDVPNGPIPANSTLIFEVELLSIEPAEDSGE